MAKIALFFDRPYIDAHYCFMDLATQLAANGYDVDLYMVRNAYNNQPFFQAPNIRVFAFPVSKMEKLEFWTQVMRSRDRKYAAIIGTPIKGAWLAYRVARLQKIPYYYLADELVKTLLDNSPAAEREKLAAMNYTANKKAVATIALGEERYKMQKELNRIDYPHDYFVIPNAPSGDAVRVKSNYFRDIFGIGDRKPILLFAGTLSWRLAKRLYEQAKSFGERDYHLIFHARTLGLMGENDHPFIKISTIPLPSYLMNYVVSSADIGLALYDKDSTDESRNAVTGGKIGTYLKNQLPLIAGNAEDLKSFEAGGVAVYWDGETDFDEIARRAIDDKERLAGNIPDFYRAHMRYDLFFGQLKDHLSSVI